MIWPIKCLILTILISTKYLQNLLIDSSLSVISTEKKNFIQGSFDDTENAKRQFFLGHPISSDSVAYDNSPPWPQLHTPSFKN